MCRKRYLRVRGFDALQHYKDHNPVWIKLYCSILEDYEFQQLQDSAKFHLIGLMLPASRLSNRFPDDSVRLASKIGASEKIEIEILIESGFLEVVSDKKEVKTDEDFDGKRTSNAGKSKKTQDDAARIFFRIRQNHALKIFILIC